MSFLWKCYYNKIEHSFYEFLFQVFLIHKTNMKIKKILQKKVLKPYKDKRLNRFKNYDFIKSQYW